MLRTRHFDDDGNCIAEDEPVLYPADSTIIAVSQQAKDKIVKSTHNVETTDKGLIKVDEHGATTREGVFAGGDVVLGPWNVVQAVKNAKIAAIAMDEYLQSKAGTKK